MRNLVLLALVASTLTLVGCEDQRPEEGRRIQNQLPPGCVFMSLGQFGDLDDVVAVVCESRNATTTSFTWNEPRGKSTVRLGGASVVFP